MILNQKQVETYKEEGAIIIRDTFKPWINILRKGFEKILENPGPHARENTSINENGRFFEDYCNWDRIPEFKKFVKESQAAEIVARRKGKEGAAKAQERCRSEEGGSEVGCPEEERSGCQASPWGEDEEITEKAGQIAKVEL